MQGTWRVGMAAAILAAWAVSAEACTASNMLDVARGSRGTDIYRVTEDVVTDHIDAEGRLDDVNSREVGIGTLLNDKMRGESRGYFSMPNGGLARSDWETVLDTGIARHGMRSDAAGTVIQVGGTMREHMRFHVWEVSESLRDGNFDAWMGTDIFSSTGADYASWKATYGGSTPPPSSTPPTGSTPTEPAPAPAPAPDPVVLHHAG